MIKKGLLSLLLLLTMVTQGAWAWDGSGTAEDPYLISSKADWDALADNVSAGNTYHGKYFAQTANIEWRRVMVGTSEYPFEGTYDGRGKTLETYVWNPTESVAAAFRYVNGATIQNLTINRNGIEETEAAILGGIVGIVSGNTTIQNCICDIHLNTSCASKVDAGGIVAYVNSGATVNVINCTYTHEIKFLNENGYGGGGIVGWVESGATANITNCTVGVYHNSNLPSAGKQFYMFANGDNGCVVNISNCFYTQEAYDSGAKLQDGSKLVPTSIYSNSDWEDFCDVIASGYNYHNNSFQKTVELFSNISVTKVAGVTNRPFRGLFDGRSHQIEVNINVESDDADTPAALFAELRWPAIIQNLNVTGTITTNGRRPASIASFVTNDSEITNCLSSVDITSSYGGDIDAGAFVGRVNEDRELTMNNCAFTGSINYTNANGYEGGGFVGWLQGGATSILTNCLFAPTSLNFTKAENDFHTFAGGYGARNHTHCYYNDLAAGEEKITTTEGKRMRSISGSDDMHTCIIDGESTNVFGVQFYNAGFKYNDAYYAGVGDKVQMKLDEKDRYGYGYDVFRWGFCSTSGTLNDRLSETPILTMEDADAVFDPLWRPRVYLTATDYFYEIRTSKAWDALCDIVENGYYSENFNTYNKVLLVNDVSGVTRMAGSRDHPFRGTFNGQDHTLTLNIDNTTAVNAGPFSVVNAATIKNLKTAGSIKTDKECLGGIVGCAIGQVVIENCSSSVAMTPTYNSGAGIVGGIVGRAEGANGERTALSGCAFTGSITLSNPKGYMGGGMVGWTQDEATATITNCLFAPTSLSFISAPGKYVFSMFASGNGTKNFTKSYYNDVAAGQPIIAIKQGKRMRSINAGFGMTGLAISGASTEYDVSGITSYSAGFKYNDVYYAGDEDQVNLTLTHADKAFTFEKYAVAGGGTLTNPATNTPKLTMSDADQTVNALWTLPVEEGATLIASKEAWDVFCLQVASGNTYSGQTVKLSSDPEGIDMVAGAPGLPFSGTFDGQDNTLYVNMNVESDDADTPAALFAELSGATIQNLNVAGSITTNGMRPASVAGVVSTGSTITNCRSSVAITSSKEGDVDAGAFVGRVNSGKTLTISDCLFTGSITYSNAEGYKGGGFVGNLSSSASATLRNCVFAPTSLGFTKAANDFHTFVGGSGTRTFTSCFYNDVAAGNSKITTIEGQQIPISIKSNTDWRNFSTVVGCGYDYSGKTVTLDAANTGIGRTVGMIGRPFKGTFDGQGNTLDADIDVTSVDAYKPAALFGVLSGATIKNLNVTGVINTVGYRPASIASLVNGNSTITNCKSSVAITSSYEGDINAGGFVATVSAGKTLTMDGCAFTGRITYSNAAGYKGGGFVGSLSSSASATLSNCIFDPAAVSINKNALYEFYMFAGGSGTKNFTNCYYNGLAADNSKITKEGKRMRSISKGPDVAILTISGESITEYAASGITAYNAGTGFNAGIKYDDVYYASNEEAVPLTLSLKPGYSVRQYLVTGGGTLDDPVIDTPTLTMSDADQTVNADILLTTISTTDDWNTFAADVSSGKNYHGFSVKLDSDLNDITTRVGTEANPFNGKFDGQGHTLNVNMNVTTGDDYIAPFAVLKDATIKNLNVAGTITTNGRYPASIAGGVSNHTYITNCRSSVAITSSYEGDTGAGGFVGWVKTNKTVIMEGCVFTGSITYSNVEGYGGGGFVGTNNSYSDISNCVFAPTSVNFANDKSMNDNKFYMFVGGWPRGELTNCYYNDVAADNLKITKEGKRMRSISAGTDVTSLAISGNATKTYDVSGITVYVSGIQYDGAYYAANGDAVNLSLSHAEKAGYAFSQYAVTGGGSLTAQTETSATLSMTDADQTISAEWIQTITLADNADNRTLISNADGHVANVTLSGRTLYKEGWNTICLPFAVDLTADGPLKGVTAKTLSSVVNDGSTVTLTFGEAVTSLAAGTPYIVKLPEEATENLVDPLFEGVTISKTLNDVAAGDGTFKGTYVRVDWTAGTKNVLFLQGNKFYYPASAAWVNPFRGYIQLKNDAPVSAGANIIIDFGDDNDNATGIEVVETDAQQDGIWYTLQGIPLDSKPTEKGIYILNGKKVAIK